ncbi:MAG: lamin tail domain-containing protein, partial [Akkermansiaceae bacterium]|nr:lamin tail domain-containing protein [Akkermansiaceae bacterium]
MRLQLAASILIGLASANAAPVISELMFHPPHLDGRENPLREWIEIHNPASREIDLTGWQITAGVSFTFPPVSISPGGYLVVAANREAFETLHPGVNAVVGDWTGRLSNRGETIRLTDHTGMEIDRVDYADSGDWATRHPGPDDRGHTGWVWHSPADGDGKTMELRNPALSNRTGQNWLPSTPELGTPGERNSAFTLNLPPLIEKVSHHPQVPGPTDLVMVRARITDDLTTPTAVVRYRVSTLDPGAFRTIEMRDDGFLGDEIAEDRVFTAVLPAQPDRTVVEFYLEAFD